MKKEEKTTAKGVFGNISQQNMQEISPFLTMGWQLVLTIMLCAGGGWWLDKHFHTKPWLFVVGAFFGAAAGMTHFIRAALRLNKKKTNDKK